MLRRRTPGFLIPILLVLVLSVGLVNGGTLGLAARWNFDEGIGTIAGDTAGGNTGTLIGSPVWDAANKPPLHGNLASLRFTGSNYVSVPDDASLDVDQVTLSAWVWIDGSNTAAQANIVRKGPTGSGSSRVYLLTVKYGGGVRGYVVLDDLRVADADGGTVLSKETWHHIAMTYDGSQVRVYIDGSLDHSSGLAAGAIADNDLNVFIGGMPGSGWNFKGNIDEVRIYNRALAASEIASLADTVPPVLTLPTDMVCEATGPAGATVEFSASATDAVDGTLPVVCVPASGSVFPLGDTTVLCSAADANGNAVLDSFTVTVQDTTPPVLQLPSAIVVSSLGPSGVPVVFSPTATDLVDGPIAVQCIPSSSTVFPLGTTTVNCSAQDLYGNTVTGSFTVTVTSDFIGYLRPVDMGGVVNVAKAGSAIPIKFSLGSDHGLDIFQDGSPMSFRVVDFETGTLIDELEVTVAAGSSGLTYDPLSDQYTYVWKTSKLWAGTSRQLVIEFTDGSKAPTANFLFKK